MDQTGRSYDELLAELRPRQRRVLRSVPTEIVREINQLSSTLDVPVLDHPFVELELRHLAEEELKDDEVAAFLTERSKTEIADVMCLILDRVAPRLHQAMVPLLQRYENDSRHRAALPNDPAGLWRLVTFLLWADRLAGDDYLDPRFPSFLTSGTQI